MLLLEYNFNPYSGQASYYYHLASGHISDCIKCLDNLLICYLQKNGIEPRKTIGQKIKQFNTANSRKNNIVTNIKYIVYTRNAFQHGKDLPIENKLYIAYKNKKIELTTEFMHDFQEKYNYIYNWFVEENNKKHYTIYQ